MGSNSNGLGFLFDDKAMDAEICLLKSRSRGKRIEGELEAWGKNVPSRFKNADINDFNSEPSVARAIGMVVAENAPLGSIILTGGGGRGKTYLAYAIARELIKTGQLRFDQFTYLSEDVFAAIYSSGFNKNERIKGLKKSRLIIIDSVGVSDSSFTVSTQKSVNEQSRFNAWFDIADWAYSGGNHNRLIVTSGLGMKDLEKHVGSPAFARLRAASLGSINMSNLPDRREMIFNRDVGKFLGKGN